MTYWTPFRRLLAGFILVMLLASTVFAARGDIVAWTNSAGADVLRLTSAGDLVPGADNSYDLGTAALSFNDAHIQGTATVGTVTATNLDGILGGNTPAAATVTALTATGAVTMNDASADNILIGAAADTVTLTSNTLSLTDDHWSVTAAGVASFVSINGLTLTAPATSATLTLADGSSLITSGANAITLTSTGATNVTLPTTGTLATLAGAEELTNKTLTAPALNGTVTTTGLTLPAFSASGNITAAAGSRFVADNGTATAETGAATLSKQAGIVTSEALTTAAGVTYTLTVTNTQVTAASNVLAQATLGTATTGIPLVTKVTPGAGSVEIVVTNIHASGALNGTILVNFLVLN